MRHIIVGLMLTFLTSLSYALESFELEPFEITDTVSYDINSQVEYLLDDSLQLSLEDVQSSNLWQPINRNIVNLGFIEQAAWFRFELKANSSNDYILHIPYPILDYIDHYSFIDGEPDLVVRTGDTRPFNSRVIDHIDFVFPYFLEAGQVLTIYLRVDTEGGVDVPLRFSSKDIFLQKDKQNTLFRGFVLGILMLMLFYNAFIFISLRDRVYGFYVLNIFAYIVTSNVYDGGAFKLIWPNTPVLNSYVFPIFFGLIQVTSIVFMMALLQVLEKDTWYKKYFLALLATVSCFPILGGLVSYSVIVPIEVAFSLIVNTSCLILGLHLSMKGDRIATYFTVAVSLFMVGLVSNNLKALGLLPTNLFTQHAYQVGFFVDMVVLSLALAQKIDQARQDKVWAQKENIKNLKRYEDLYRESLSGNFQVTLAGKIVSVNKAFVEMLGYDNELELLQTKEANNISLFSTDKNNSKHIINTVRETGNIIDFEEEVYKKDGSTIWISLSVRSVNNSDGEAEYYEGSILDINQRKEIEQIKERDLQDRMSTLEQLVVGISHELNTPLGTSITSVSHINQLVTEMNDRQHNDGLDAQMFDSIIQEEFQAVDITHKNLARVCELIKQFKHISVSQHGYNIESANLFALLSCVSGKLENTLADNAIQLILECDETINVHTYGGAISEILSQFILNSIDHAFAKETDKSIKISARCEGENIEIHYQDTGVGLSEKGKAELFNPFYTTMRGSQGKIGLGMYLTYNLITQLLQGQVEVEKPEKGIAILITFPISISE